MIKIQGTDGIRGYIEQKPLSVSETGQRNPLKIFLEKNILIPEFFELYAYGFCQYLLQEKLAKKRDYIMVGKDTRDTDFRYTQACLDGIKKAGMRLRFLDIVPTPALAFYLVKRGRSGALMLTASHNPDNQNGIKIFLPQKAMKMLPDQEAKFSQLLQELPYPIPNSSHSKKLFSKPKKSLKNKAIRQFVRNLCKQMKKDKNFSKTILMVDCANGAVTETVEKVFKVFKFHKTTFFNTQGRINHNCGVAELEGRREILASDVVAGGVFSHHQLLVKMFAEATSNIKIDKGELFLTGFIFDGDGDRFMRAEYDPYAKKIQLLTGDNLAIHFLRSLGKKEKIVNFYNTIESDLQIKIFAESQGWKQIILPVGDRWLLQKANETGGFFQLGYEDSGHFIFPTYIKLRKGVENASKLDFFKRDQLFFTGNGILAALKSLPSIFSTCGNTPSKEFFHKLQNQYPVGILKNLAIYEVNKEMLHDTEFTTSLHKFVVQQFRKLKIESLSIKKENFADQPDLHYWTIQQQQSTKAAIFIRNSGTEDKTSLYLRGHKKWEDKLYFLLEEIHLFLIQSLKVKNTPNYKISLNYLKMVLKNDFKAIETLEQQDNTSLIIQRIKNKEKLVFKKHKRWALSSNARKWLKSN